MDLRSIHAQIRFGLGPRLGAPAPRDPDSWLLGQLAKPDLPQIDPPVDSAAGLAELAAIDRRKSSGMGPTAMRLRFQSQANSLLAHGCTTTTPFHERLVWFWANHFTISIRRAKCIGVAVSFVEEAIRPHVNGKFSDMVLAVMRHPAMLLYLDNIQSYGPDSPASRRGRRGLNENLARECLELHTVSLAAGYTQSDVTALANLLTGWTVDMERERRGFWFNPQAHQPGQQQLLGRVFPSGEEGGIAALTYLANHPATHRALATALARHFVADEPPADAVRRIEGVLRDSGGDLAATSRALVGLEAAWRDPGAKLRQPKELFFAAMRAVGASGGTATPLTRPLSVLGQPLLAAPAPDGWPDVTQAWATPQLMLRRIDWAYAFATRLGARDPMEIADTALGPLLRPATRDAMANAGSRADALTLLLTSPEFQRR